VTDILDLGSWFILRMASADTLKVADQLAKRGFDVWTPVRKVLGKPRKDGEPNERRHAVTPGYVFANLHHMPEIDGLASVPSNDLPRFTLFRTAYGDAPLIGDRALDGLREKEGEMQRDYEMAVAKSKPLPVFKAGHVSALRGGGFDGLDATVIEHRGKFVLVDIPGFNMPIEVSSLLLLGDEVCAKQSEKRVLRHRNRRAA